MSKQPNLTKAYDGRGADMGRRAVLPDDPAQPIRLHLARMRMTADGCYDAGGAYWGCGTAASGGMWLAWASVPTCPHEVSPDRYLTKCPVCGVGLDERTDVRVFTRATNRDGAKANIVKVLTGATFYR